MASSPRGTGRRSLGASDGRSVGRSPEALPAVPDVSSSVPGVGKTGSVQEDSAAARRRPPRTRPNRSHRGVHRWLPRGGKKGGALVGKTRRGKATQIMAVADRHGLPIAVGIGSGERHETKLVQDTLRKRFVDETPERLIGDCAYDSDPLDAELAAQGIEMIAPNRSTRRRKTQDGRPLRRYRRRWKVERLFAWFFQFRRLVTRYESKAENFEGFLLLAAAMILMRRVVR